MPEISVVIPAYNAEKYIDRAIESLRCQTFTNWECIVINDGSTDSTLDILKYYAKLDSRLKFDSIPNSGSAKIPRDHAITKAQSSWIFPLDADDYIAPQTLEALYHRQQETKADIVILRLEMFDDQTEKIIYTIPGKEFDFSQILPGKEAVMLTLGKWQIPGNGLFSKELLHARNSLLNDYNQMNADEYDTRDMFIKAEKIAFADVPYYYRQFSNSTTKKLSYKLFEPIITDRLLINLLEEAFGQNSLQKRFMEKIYFEHFISSYFTYAYLIKKLPIADRLKAKEIINSERQHISLQNVRDSNISFTKKIFLHLPCSCLFLLSKIYCIVKSR